nr:MAG TPA: dUTPase [Caudoviricetes sp.]
MARFEIVSKYVNDRELLTPKRATAGSVGYDLVCAVDTIVPSSLIFFQKITRLTGMSPSEIVTLDDVKKYIVQMEKAFGQRLRPTLVPTGIKIYCNPNEYFAVCSRSGMPLKHLLLVANSIGIVDSDYADNPGNEGEIFVQFLNLSPYDIEIKKGERIAQGMFIPTIVAENDNYNDNERLGGHGSTGVQ